MCTSICSTTKWGCIFQNTSCFPWQLIGLINNYLNGRWKEVQIILFSLVPNTRTRWNGHTLEHSNIRKHLTVWVTEHRHKLLKEAIESPWISWKVTQAWCSTPYSWYSCLSKCWTRWAQKSLPASAILLLYNRKAERTVVFVICASVRWKSWLLFESILAEVICWENEGRNKENSTSWSCIRKFVGVNQRQKKNFPMWRVTVQIKRDIDKNINTIEMKSICIVIEAISNQTLYQLNIICISVARYLVLRSY